MTSNRFLGIVIIKDDFLYTTSYLQLDGEHSPATFSRYYDTPEAGEYQAVVELSRSEGGESRSITERSGVVIVN